MLKKDLELYEIMGEIYQSKNIGAETVAVNVVHSGMNKYIEARIIYKSGRVAVFMSHNYRIEALCKNNAETLKAYARAIGGLKVVSLAFC